MLGRNPKWATTTASLAFMFKITENNSNRKKWKVSLVSSLPLQALRNPDKCCSWWLACLSSLPCRAVAIYLKQQCTVAQMLKSQVCLFQIHFKILKYMPNNNARGNNSILKSFCHIYSSLLKMGRNHCKKRNSRLGSRGICQLRVPKVPKLWFSDSEKSYQLFSVFPKVQGKIYMPLHCPQWS